MNSDLSRVYKDTSPIICTIPVISESTIYEFQFNNSSKVPIDCVFKFNKCIICTSENNIKKINNKKDYGTLANKCVHYKNIQISPKANLKVL